MTEMADTRFDAFYRDANAFHPRTGKRISNDAEYFDARNGPVHVGSTFLRWKKYQVRVSTVHLINDHDFGLTDTPVLFETQVRGDDVHRLPEPGPDFGWGDIVWRYSWEDEAVTGHANVVWFLTKLLVYHKHTVVTVPDRDTPIIRAEVME